MELRPYQQEAVNGIRAAFAGGYRAPLLVAPTASGKTFTFAYIAKHAAAKGNRVLILVHRRELMVQTLRSLRAIDVDCGAIQAGFTYEPQKPVQVASIQTLVRRLDNASVNPSLIIVDECHHANAGTWSTVINHYERAKVLGVTATPCRTDGRGLGDVFDTLIEAPNVKWMIENGYLSRYRAFAPLVDFDPSEFRTTAGDFNIHDMEESLDKPAITGDVIAHYEKYSRGLPAIAFCTTVRHAEHTAVAFQEAGWRFQCLHGGMKQEARDAAINGLATGQLDGLTSCDIISEGTDIPVVTTAILLRPTQSMGLFLQQVGRVLRTAPGKDHAIILDHVGNISRHGLPCDERAWTLDPTKPKKSKKKPAASVKNCPQCYAAVSMTALKCPECEYRFTADRPGLLELDGELVELTPENRPEIRKKLIKEAATLEDLIKIGHMMGYKPKWAYHFHKNSRRFQA